MKWYDKKYNRFVLWPSVFIIQEHYWASLRIHVWSLKQCFHTLIGKSSKLGNIPFECRATVLWPDRFLTSTRRAIEVVANTPFSEISFRIGDPPWKPDKKPFK